MRKSRAGLSDIIVMVFVTLSVVTCCVGWYLYQVGERNRNHINALTKRSDGVQKRIEELIDQAREISTRAGFKAETGMPSSKPLEDLLSPLKTDLKLPGSDANIQDSFIPLEGKIYAAETRLQLSRAHLGMAQDSRDESRLRLNMIDKALTAEMDRLKGRFEELSKQLADEGNAFAERIDALTQEEQKLRDELTATQRRYADEGMRVQNETARLEQELQRLQQREALVRDITRPAGQIVFADRNAHYAYVNLGTGDRVREGTKFLVYRLGKGGVREDKGEVEIKRVFDDQAQVSITRTNNDFDPITEGDLIENPLYNRGEARRVVLIGTFNQRDYRYTTEDLKARLVRAGAVIEDKISINTDYVITGAEVAEDDPNYKQAALLSVPTVPMARILPYLGD